MNMDLQMLCGKFWISPKELPKKEPLRSVMVDILNCQPNDCGDKGAYLELVECSAESIIKSLKKCYKRDLKRLLEMNDKEMREEVKYKLSQIN